VASVSIVAITALAVGAAGLQLSRDDYVAWHLTRLASLEGIPAAELNNAAWFIAIGKEVTEAQLEAALKLAERAVDETGGEHATMIDTLAELQFQLGHSEAAVVTIDRAIALEPEESYYREQRRRFTGERPAHDRPPDPLFRPRERSLPVPALKEGEVPV
jgi:tetratricopeptide (TPR) repeat protein